MIIYDNDNNIYNIIRSHLKLSVRSYAIFLGDLCELDATEMKMEIYNSIDISNARAYMYLTNQ